MSKSSAVLVAIALGFVGMIFYFLMTVSPVKVVNKRLEREGGQVFVTGEVQNESTRPTSIDLEVHYFDADGHPLGQDKLALDDLKPGSTTPFKSPARAGAGVSDFSLYLNHGRDPYGN